MAEPAMREALVEVLHQLERLHHGGATPADDVQQAIYAGHRALGHPTPSGPAAPPEPPRPLCACGAPLVSAVFLPTDDEVGTIEQTCQRGHTTGRSVSHELGQEIVASHWNKLQAAIADAAQAEEDANVIPISEYRPPTWRERWWPW